MMHIVKIHAPHDVMTPVVMVVGASREQSHRQVSSWLYRLAADVELDSEGEKWVVVVNPSAQMLEIEVSDGDDPAELERAVTTLKICARRVRP